ncbi:hypothetical protein BM613_05355 [Sulfoacidibacillus thermotolerans]|uniref:Putative amidase domain-containing protein n=2 Tax=Sulfoacidibacillus thermotolerans TaxID=1765684 RepID=A0A2U3DA27_SULT2|nr:hypothetical protein BM613_05355 [Sulfoacidibacillus thermotolerans]
MWIERDYETLYTTGGIQPAVVEMNRRDQLFAKRGAVDKKTITDVQLKLSSALDPTQTQVVARESIRFIYELCGRLEHEQRVIDHVFTWQVDDAQVKLVSHRHRNEQVQSAPNMQDEGGDLLPDGDWIRTESAITRYERILAHRYAELWWDRANPEYPSFAEDCTNFISQVLHAGRIPLVFTDNRESGWWFRAAPKMEWSYSWSVAHALIQFLRKASVGVRVHVVDDPKKLHIGDVIGYDWTGSGTYHHMTVVTNFDANGDPLVNAHTVNSRMRHYSYEDSYAWTEHTRYLFLHIAN